MNKINQFIDKNRITFKSIAYVTGILIGGLYFGKK